MENIEQIIDLMVKTMLDRLGDEIDLIFQYGSCVRGNMHRYSDIDLSFVPVHEETWDNITVMVDETLFDFYPMRWSTLEKMADFRDLSSSVLATNKVIYVRNDLVLTRFNDLSAKLLSLQQPQARSEMVYKAMQIYQSTAYDYYLLQQQHEVGHLAGCLRQSMAVLRILLHCLAVFNQACVDTRKIDQVLALPRLPVNFAIDSKRIIDSFDIDEIFEATCHLMQSTRDLIVSEQNQMTQSQTNYSDVFDSGYPELKRDLQGVMLACERRDPFGLKTSLLSLMHELSRGVAQVERSVNYTGFNGLSEYEQDLEAMGFPDLLCGAVNNDYEIVLQQCYAFDRRLREFLTSHSVRLNNFTNYQEFKQYLAVKN